MDKQTDEYPTTPPTIVRPSTVSPRQPFPPLSASVPALRFPKPQGSPHLANWVSSSAPDIMQPSSQLDDAGLSESTFELVGTDIESQDGAEATGTESVSSLDFPTGDDVQSLTDTDRVYGEDESDEEHEGLPSAPSLEYALKALQSPSTHLKANLEYAPPTESQTPLARSIEFQEDVEVVAEGPVYFDKISVKHTIRDFNEEETVAITNSNNIRNPPRRMIATIRQTMSQGCLSTREPLRILYVGDPAGEREIIYKISSALTASGSSDGSGRTSCVNTDGIFNIVPISSFGSSKAPEIELMETSGYQIKVERCSSAKEIIYRGESFPDDVVYSITIDQDKTYHSAFLPSGSVIQPKWSLPHVAIFFQTDKDGEAVQETRDIAWEIMTRHGVPSIFISHKQSFVKPRTGRWRDFVDQHAVHMCLESRDPDRPILPERLPIDLASFLNIDARQMNRNLAYLVGSEEPIPFPLDVVEPKCPVRPQDVEVLEGFSSTGKAIRRALERFREDDVLYFTLRIVVAAVFALGLAVFAYPRASPPSQPVVLSAVSPASISTIISLPPSIPVPPPTATVTINLTSTKTVKIALASPSSTSLSSQLPFGGFLSDKAQTVLAEPGPKKTVCSVEIFSEKEILVKVPSGNKAVWLAKGAIEIDVLRGTGSIKSKLSSIDEGILIEISKKDAYGVLNISVITSRKPKINETFEVNFGKPVLAEVVEAGVQILHDLAKMVTDKAEKGKRLVEKNCAPAVAALAERLREDAGFISESIKDAGKLAQDYSTRVKSGTVARVKDSLNPESMANLLRGAQEKLGLHRDSVERLREDVDISILKTQITSKLWWLKIQGKMDKYAEYEKKATSFLKKNIDMVKARRSREDGDGEPGYLWGRRKSNHASREKDAKKPWGKRRGGMWNGML